MTRPDGTPRTNVLSNVIRRSSREYRSIMPDLTAESLRSRMAMIDDGKKTEWNALVDQILSKKGRIIALRGAGSINGADPAESNRLLENELLPRIQNYLARGEHVTFLFDGDPDDPKKPDIGYFAGRLLDTFGNNQNGVDFVTAQKRSWYYPSTEKGNLANAHGRDYVTYVFADDKYPGDHNAFTQDARLVASPKYEQWYIGASGDIATSQLEDFNAKVHAGHKKTAVLFRVHNNKALSAEISKKLTEAQGDEAKFAKFTKQLAQRDRVYGAHWDNNGNPVLDVKSFPKLNIQFVA